MMKKNIMVVSRVANLFGDKPLSTFAPCCVIKNTAQMLHLTYMDDEVSRNSAQSRSAQNHSIHNIEYIDRDYYSLSVEEVVAMFTEAGVPRSTRTIQHYCKINELDNQTHKVGNHDKYFINRQSALDKIEATQQMERLAQMRDISREETPLRDIAHQQNQHNLHDANARQAPQDNTQRANTIPDNKPDNQDETERKIAQMKEFADKAIDALQGQLKSITEAKEVIEEANREANQKLIDKDTQLAIKEKEMIKQKEVTGFLYSYAYKMENEGVFKRAWKKISGKKKLLPDPSEGYQLDEVVDDLPKLE